MSTPYVPTYVENEYHLGFFPSITQSFLLTLIAELGDRTFIMLILLTMQTSKGVVLFGALTAEIGMNLFAMLIGKGIDILLYKNVIDYIGILIFTFFGIWLIFKFVPSKVASTFEEELEGKWKPKEEEKGKGKSAKDQHIELVDESKEELMSGQQQKEEEELRIKEEQKEEDQKDDDESSQLLTKRIGETTPLNQSWSVKWAYYKIICYEIATTECGDRTQFTTMAMSAIFDIKGVLIGSCSALALTIIIGVFLGRYFTVILREQMINFILGCLVLTYAFEILYKKIYGQELF